MPSAEVEKAGAGGTQGPRRLLGMPAAAAQYARRATRTARNVAEVVRFGGLQTDESSSPYVVAAEQPNYRLRHYFADDAIDAPGAADAPGAGPPVLLVPPLMLTTEIWDVSPSASAVVDLHAAGIDAWVVDFGDPVLEPGGRERDLTDHVLAVSDAVDRVQDATGHEVVLAGYSQGGMFAYQAAAYRRSKGIDSLVTLGAPVDTMAALPIPFAPEFASRFAHDLVESGLLRKVSVPGWVSRTGFKLLTPAKSVQGRVQFLLALHDRDALLPRERQRRFLESEGWAAYSGPAIAELLEQFVMHNRMLEGGFVIDDRLVTLADVDVPVLTFVGSSDTFGHPRSVRAIAQAAPRASVYEVTLDAGHFGLVVGSAAKAHTWPAVADWVRWRAAGGDVPAGIVPSAEVAPARPIRPSAAASAVAQATELGIGVGRVVVGSARRASRLTRNLAREAPAQLPRLSRIERLDPDSRISLALLLDERAGRAPHDVVFLFGDRAYRQHDVKARVDNVVRGLISIGVHQGDRVGVLMGTRPSAVTVVAALSRLGATAVLLRPDGDVAREVELGGVTTVVADPEHAVPLERLDGIRAAILGSGGRDGAAGAPVPPGVVDMEGIDPAEVELPAWFRPNPHRARDVAFVVFTGEGASTRTVPITNRRWALSALGTASAAALRPGDTIYSVTPLHHSSALLMSIGGAVAGGARFALAGADDPQTFWEEVRRYGATHVSYTWTSLADVVDGPAHPNEAHHPIRMFMGSGMPRNLWRRVNERFPTARVLEFYASTVGEAILANVSGRAPGSMGKPLPGTPAVRVAAVDLLTGRLEIDDAGLARECTPDEVGLLLAAVDPRAEATLPAAAASAPPLLRGLFTAGDAWRSTGDLFLRDDDGDLWLAGSLAEVVATVEGAALPAGARYALGTIAAVQLVVAYGVPAEPAAELADGTGAQLLVAACTLRPGCTADPDEFGSALDKAVGRLPRSHRPHYVQVVASIPVTTWHRPVWRTLQAKGAPRPARGRRVWRLDDGGGHYDLVK